MAYPPASDVPIPELIRRGYDRAKGLGHGGLDDVRRAHRGFLASLRGVAPEALPSPAALRGQPQLVFHPSVLVGLYAPGEQSEALSILMAALAGTGQVCATHPWLKEAVAAFQSAGHNVRTVALWIAAMTVLPRWGAPGADLPEGASGLLRADRATLVAAADALDHGPTLLMVPEGPLAQLGRSIEGITVVT